MVDKKMRLLRQHILRKCILRKIALCRDILSTRFVRSIVNSNKLEQFKCHRQFQLDRHRLAVDFGRNKTRRHDGFDGRL